MASLERYGRKARWFHAGVYLFTFVTLGTGLWIHFGQEGRASFLARLLNRPDIVIHEDAGWVLIALTAAAVLFGIRGIMTFVTESVRYERSDARWLLGWPRAVFTGKFRRHEGHFDPGQRVANLVIAAGLLILIASGTLLVFIHGGAWFVRLAFVHRWTAIVLTPIIAGHVIVASGLLPGYRGVWRSMHLHGRVNRDTAERLWPAWLEEQPRSSGTLSASRGVAHSEESVSTVSQQNGQSRDTSRTKGGVAEPDTTSRSEP
jgi:formate dehydrogenase subunit gamma